MAGVSGQSFDAERTVVVLNCPSNVGEEELTIHFQKVKHGGGDVDEVTFSEDGTVAFVSFDMPEGLEYFIVYIAGINKGHFPLRSLCPCVSKHVRAHKSRQKTLRLDTYSKS